MAHTHIDSLCHMFFEGKMYNGFSQTNVTSHGALQLGISNLKQGPLGVSVAVGLSWYD